MTLQVIGAGLGRTGTHSLAAALELLGFDPCYHILELDRNPGHLSLWSDALDGKPVDWNTIYESYRSAVEWPTVSFLPQVIAQYPQAKVILTQRDPGSWYESANATIFEGLELSAHNPNPARRESSAFKRQLILETVFGGKYRDKAHAIKVYMQHTINVMQLVPAERLLQYRVTEGWEPLCDFLGVDVPGEPFPRRNDRASHLNQMPDWARRRKDKD